MKRPSDQAKLLFFAFLRSTVSALATSETKVAPYSVSALSSSVAVEQQPHITLRLARRTDVPYIQRCNLATLPENYNDSFYANHLRTWPELALVAECNDNNKSRLDQNQNPFAPSQPNIVAYVLGKVEDRHRLDTDSLRYDPYSERPKYKRERSGHVTSLAVLEGYRRQGLARELMESLHYHLQACYQVDSVGLHVRQSNHAAARLYGQFGYTPDERISAYYQDGEDAFFMKKQLPALHKQPLTPQGLFGINLRRSKPWESGPEHLMLPRSVGRRSNRPPHLESEESEEEEEAPELMTGTM